VYLNIWFCFEGRKQSVQKYLVQSWMNKGGRTTLCNEELREFVCTLVMWERFYQKRCVELGKLLE
jgi:hypothetical protein